MQINPVTMTAWASWILILCTLITVIWQNSVTRNLARIQLFADIWNRYQTPEMKTLRQTFARSLLNGDIKAELDESVLLFFETLAYLTRKRNLDRRMVWNTFSYEIKTYWTAAEPLIHNLRNKNNDETIFIEMEWLYHNMLAMEIRLRHKTEAEILLTPSQVEDLLRLDANMPDFQKV